MARAVQSNKKREEGNKEIFNGKRKSKREGFFCLHQYVHAAFKVGVTKFQCVVCRKSKHHYKASLLKGGKRLTQME